MERFGSRTQIERQSRTKASKETSENNTDKEMDLLILGEYFRMFFKRAQVFTHTKQGFTLQYHGEFQYYIFLSYLVTSLINSSAVFRNRVPHFFNLL